LADEFKGGTYEILQTKPLGYGPVVSGKYPRLPTIATMALLPTLLYAFSMQQLMPLPRRYFDTGAPIGAYIGSVLAAVFTAIGICCSGLIQKYRRGGFMVSAFAHAHFIHRF